MLTVREEYIRAMHMGNKEKKKLEGEGRTPFPLVFDVVHPSSGHLATMTLPVQDIPLDRIVGTRRSGRENTFSASFLPLPEPDSEFASKWMALCEAHLSDTGISDPIECYEYFGDFFVQEGNKRVSVLRYFGAVSISARIHRILPAADGSPETEAYREFTEFHRETGLYDIQFKKPGEFLRLRQAMGKKPEELLTKEDGQRLAVVFHRFKKAFTALGGPKEDLLPEEALLTFLRVHSYGELTDMSSEDLRKALQVLWGDVKASAEPEAIKVVKTPAAEEKGVIERLLTGTPRHLNVAFIYQRDRETSPWTRGHLEGAESLTRTFYGTIAVRHYFHADSSEKAQELIDEAVARGADVVFTTTPPLLHDALKAAVRHPKVRFFNCSACQPLSSVRSYYCRTYEGKFITGLIAGAMADNDLVGYVGSYPILGVPASINAFAAGVRMTNPRARVLLDWSCLAGDPAERLKERGVSVISHRDIPLPDAGYLESGQYGVVGSDGSGQPLALASPCWMWGRLYERIVRSILGGNERKEGFEAVNYWLGMDSGAIDIVLSPRLPAGVRDLAIIMEDRIRKGDFDPFMLAVTGQDGTPVSDGSRRLTPLEILQMDRLSDVVEGRIPQYEELLPISKQLVRELGAHLVDVPVAAEEET